MLKLRTKTAFNVPKDRGFIPVIVHLIVDSIMFDVNNATVKGYYYYIDTSGNVVMLDDFNKVISWSIITQTEIYVLQSITSPNLFDIVKQRLKDFTMLQLEQENGKNYGTVSTDWEEDI